MPRIKALEESGALGSWAASEATKVLADNWNAALQDGWELEELVKDTDEVIKLLREWADSVLEGADVQTET